MNKAGKHVQMPNSRVLSPIGIGSGAAPKMFPISPPQKNVINSIMSFLPDNRPITSLQIVEDYEKYIHLFKY